MQRDQYMTIDGHSGVKLQDANKVMDELLVRKQSRKTIYPEHVMDLDIRWFDQDRSHEKDGWYAKIDGTDMILDPNAVRTASKLIKSRSSYWQQFQDKNAFPASLRHILDNKKIPKHAEGRVCVRHNGKSVNAILHPLYEVRDAYDMLQPMLEEAESSIGEVRGISVIESSSGDIFSYRIVVGQNFIPQVSAQYGQYSMILLYTSEVGACESGTGQGMFRTSCTNSSILRALMKTWNHLSDSEDFYSETHKNIRLCGYYQGQYAKIFGELLNTKLDVPGEDLLKALLEERLITSGHYDASAMYIDTPTEDGRPIQTQYDFFNVLTRGAQDIDSIVARQKAESVAMTLFTDPGGVFEQIRKAALERARLSGR